MHRASRRCTPCLALLSQGPSGISTSSWDFPNGRRLTHIVPQPASNGMSSIWSGLDDAAWRASPQKALRQLVEGLRAVQAAGVTLSEGLLHSRVGAFGGWVIARLPPVPAVVISATRTTVRLLPMPAFASRLLAFAMPGLLHDGMAPDTERDDAVTRLEAWVLGAMQSAGVTAPAEEESLAVDATVLGPDAADVSVGSRSWGDSFKVVYLVLNKALRSLRDVRGQSPSAVLASLIRHLADAAERGVRGERIRLADLLSPGAFDPYEPVPRLGQLSPDGYLVRPAVLLEYREKSLPVSLAAHRRSELYAC